MLSDIRTSCRPIYEFRTEIISDRVKMLVWTFAGFKWTQILPSDQDLGPKLWLCPCMVGVGQGLNWGPPKGAIAIPFNKTQVKVFLLFSLRINSSLIFIWNRKLLRYLSPSLKQILKQTNYIISIISTLMGRYLDIYIYIYWEREIKPLQEPYTTSLIHLPPPSSIFCFTHPHVPSCPRTFQQKGLKELEIEPPIYLH